MSLRDLREEGHDLGPACPRCGLHGDHVCLDGIEAYASQRLEGAWEETYTAGKTAHEIRARIRKRAQKLKGERDGS